MAWFEAKQAETIRNKKVLTVAEAIDLLKQVDPSAILIRSDEGCYFGCTNLYDHDVTDMDERLGWKVKKGQKAYIFV